MVEHHPRASVLNRKTTFVKFNGNRIFTCKRTNRNKIFNKLRRNKDIRHGNWSGIRWKICMTYVSDRKRGAITDGDASGSVDGIGGVEVTGISGHMRGSSSVHIPLSAADVAGW